MIIILDSFSQELNRSGQITQGSLELQTRKNYYKQLVLLDRIPGQLVKSPGGRQIFRIVGTINNNVSISIRCINCRPDMSTRKWGNRCLSVSPKPRMASRHFLPVGADIAQQNCFHRGFSDRAEYQRLFPREEDLLWRQRSSDITSKRQEPKHY